MNRRLLAALLGGSMLATACFELDLPTIQPTGGTTYTRAEIIASPMLMERLVGGTFVLLWAEVRNYEPWVHLSIYGEEITTSASDISGEVFGIIKEPRGQIPNFLGVDHTVMRDPWHLFYESNSSAAEYYGIVKSQNIRIIDPATKVDNTERFLAFARFVQGISHVYLGLLFDSAAIVNEEVDLSKPSVLPLAGHYEVLDSAVRWLQEAADRATASSFAFPLNEGEWIYRTGFDNTQLAAVAHSYIARALVYGARTPEERAGTCSQPGCRNVDWTVVKSHLEKATRSDFGPRGFPASGGGMGYRRTVSSAPIDPPAPDIICNGECSNAGNMRVDTRIVGPADTTGEYQTWLAKVAGDRFDTVAPISIETYDARIQAVGGSLPNVKPVYFKYTDLYPPTQQMDTALRGKYYVSNYWSSSRARNNHTQFPNTGGGNNEDDDLNLVQDEMVLKVEMDLMRAEADLRLGGAANIAEAVALINQSREINGELPPVTAAGVPDNIPGKPCIPRAYDGTPKGRCGTLFEAMMYEKRIETWGIAVSYFDARGWGCLLQGTAMQMAPPANQLDLLGKLVYSYGGIGSSATAGAPKPTACPLIHKP